MKKINDYDEYQTKATQLRSELISAYESKLKYHEIEQIEMEPFQIDLSFSLPPSIELMMDSNEIFIMDESNSSAKHFKTDSNDDISDEFKKIIQENGIKKYDFDVFQRVFGDDDDDGMNKVKEDKVKKGKKEKLICHICDVAFKTLNNYLIHKADHDKEKYHISCTNDILNTKKFHCFCGKKFLYKLSYTQHLKIHNNIREYPCTYEMCQFQAINSAHLQRHVRAKHTKEKNHQCNFCGRRFAERYNMRSHIKKQHSSSKKDLFN